MMRLPLSSTITYRISCSAVRISWTRMGVFPFQLHHQPPQRPMSRTLRTILQGLRYFVNSQGKRDYFLSFKTMTMPLLSPLDNVRFFYSSIQGPQIPSGRLNPCSYCHL